MGVKTSNPVKKGILLVLFLYSFTISYSQFHHGIEVGTNLNNADFMAMDRSSDTKFLSGFNFGYVAERDFSDNLYIRFAVLANRRGLKTVMRRGTNETKESWGLGVIEIPINFGYYLNYNARHFQFFVDAGFNTDINFRAFTENPDETITIDIGGDNDIKRISNGVNIGTGVLIQKRVKLRIHYYHGLTSVFNLENNEWKNKSFGISVNYFLRPRAPKAEFKKY